MRDRKPSYRLLGAMKAMGASRRMLLVPLIAVLLILLYAWTLRGSRWPAKHYHRITNWEQPDPQELLDLLPLPDGDPTVLPEAAMRIILAKEPYVPPKREKRNFEGFNNETGDASGEYIVPNFVHFLRFNQEEFDFLDFVVVLSALRHQKPERLFFHTNVKRFRGELWEKLLMTPGFADVTEMVHVDLPSEIFGQPMDNGNRVWHAGDITRIRILMKYGGIFLDNDSYQVKSLDPFRRFELAIGWDDDQFLGTQVIVAHPDARFLNEWLETYRGAYFKDKWYYNAGERPTVEVLYKRPEHIHRVKLLFGVHYLIHKVFKANEVWAEWRDQYTIHLLKRHQEKTVTQDNFLTPPTTLREMILDLYNPISGRPRLF
ncbi:uncharacterized protein LOC117640652 [Thrips palmi]|uniref:Uncharacterized protein LOC117640652 n=1 Tax=Thrips palmi TaxID=161013 RepID=A0A6P8YAR0_THRPL|nr:uncharacterized protein LOC117640652 [Thrips palmi]